MDQNYDSLLAHLNDDPGNQDVWSCLFRHLWPFVLSRCWEATGGATQADLEDVSQEAFIAFARYWRDYPLNRPRTADDLRGLFVVLVRNTATDWARKLHRARRDVRRQEGLPTDDSFPPATERTPTAMVDDQDLIGAILLALPQQKREVVRLTLEGCTNEEISQSLRIDVRSVRRLRGQAFDFIRQRWPDAGS